MNKYDSAKLEEILQDYGYLAADQIKDCDLILVNTCCVRQHAENRAFGFIASLKNLKMANPNLIIGICGCIPKQENVDLQSKFPFVDLVMGPNEPEKLKPYLNSPPLSVSLNKNKRGESQGGSELVTIIHGCNNYCSYCIVPYVRGREFSRPMDEVLSEIKGLVERGVTDITLLGQNVNSYRYGLANLLREIGRVFPHPQFIIHFMTSHPRDMSDEIIETVYELPYVAKEFHLPVQSGDDTILAKMNRGYTVGYYRGLIAKIRSLMPNARITTDIIVGFPGETEEQFQNTLNLVEEIRFNAVNMAAYSLRSQTLSAKMPGHLPEEVKQDRLQRLIRVVKRIASEVKTETLVCKS